MSPAELEQIARSIMNFLGEVIIAAGGGAVIAYLLFTTLGNKWLDAKFSERLEHYRYEINSLFNRVTKIHEKEFEVLPAAWQKLLAAHGHLALLIQDVRQFSQMDEEQQRKWWEGYNQIRESFVEFHDYLLYNSIFLSPDLYSEFKAADKLFDSALAKTKAAKQGLKTGELMLEVYEAIYEQIEPIKERIRELIQRRLHYQDAG